MTNTTGFPPDIVRHRKFLWLSLTLIFEQYKLHTSPELYVGS